MSVREGKERRETAGITTRLIVSYVRDQLGADAVTTLLALAGETRPVTELEDEGTWSTYDQKIALFAAAADLTGDPRVAYRIGTSVLDARLGRPLRMVIGALGSPQRVLASIARASVKFSTSATMRTIETSARHGAVGYRVHPDHTPSRYDCDYNQGLLSRVTVLFGLPPARIEHPACQVEGAPECVYVLRWPPLRRLAPGARRRARATVTDALRAQVTDLEQAVHDILGAGDLDGVLSRTAARAGVAVRAQYHLLALRLEDGSQRLIGDGLDPALTRRYGDVLLERGVLDSVEHDVIVAPVATARRRYGALAAFLPAGTGFLPAEQEHLEAYAGLVAASVEAATALAAERRSAVITDTLLRLSSTLAVLESEEAIAEAVAAAVPTVSGADRASVLRWDGEARRLVTLAAVGYGERTAARIELEVPLEATPLLQHMLDDPFPIVITSGTDDPYLAAVLARFGSRHVTVVPLRDQRELLGVLVASQVHDAGVATEALLGVADQAAVAIARRRLITTALHAATHDRLTGLPARELLNDRLERALADHRRTGRRVAVCFLDLDGFKGVNDRHGHASGDRILVEVAQRLLDSVRASDTVARVSGDEFVVLLRELSDAEDVHRSAAAIVAAVGAPVRLPAIGEVAVGASLGIAVVGEHGSTPDELLSAADAAMYEVKHAGGHAYALAR
ncbi:MAG: diguanylate cyclase domain-containing protein [Nitriliruptoraceae bacterium]